MRTNYQYKYNSLFYKKKKQLLQILNLLLYLELWQKEIFEKLVKHIKKEGVLVTYCAKGEVKRILKALGCERHVLILTKKVLTCFLH
ncbi:MnmC family methyltransferase [bacterium]|nr:MnmC family methyltransferase [bacterium]